jgi:hypothetical protein
LRHTVESPNWVLDVNGLEQEKQGMNQSADARLAADISPTWIQRPLLPACREDSREAAREAKTASREATGEAAAERIKDGLLAREAAEEAACKERLQARREAAVHHRAAAVSSKK